jgi:DNA end-binding protein Ku
MPRPLWTGSLSFGLVNVPVMLVTAVRDQGFHFRQLHSETHRPIEVKRFCSVEDTEVPYEEIGHGYDLEGELVVITDEDLQSIEPRKTRTVEVESFVPLEDVDPIFFDHPYLLLPIGDSEGTLRAYQLLVEVMKETDKAAFGRFVMRTKEYLVLVRARGDLLALTTLRRHDEVRPRDEVAPSSAKESKARKAAVEQAVALIDELTVEWDPDRYEDHYRERLAAVIDSKRKGGTVKAPTPEKEPTPTPDLMAALEETLASIKSGGGSSASKPKAKDADLSGLSKKELLSKAADADVEGRSKMTKDELVEALS